MISVETDFFQKDSFYQKITNHASETSNYFIEDLGYRIDEMKDKKKIFNFKSNQLKKINDDFFFQIRGLTVIGENDALFIKINNFSEIIKKEGEELINAYEEYQKSSLGFEQVALISKNIWNQNRIKP